MVVQVNIQGFLQPCWCQFEQRCMLASSYESLVAPELAFYLGLAMWIAGFAIEVIADRQKTAFRADPANADAFIGELT